MSEPKNEQKLEIIEFPDWKVPVYRQPTDEMYLALEPPSALPYLVAPLGLPVETIAHFVQQRLGTLGELRKDMLKHFKKTKSLKCRFRTGDVTPLLGRPFMIRVMPLSRLKPQKKGGRGRANMKAVMHNEISVIDLYVVQPGSYDQGKLAFMSYAKPVFTRNIQTLLRQCMERVFPEAQAPGTVSSRPMREARVRFDEVHDTVWFSESLIPYPPHAIVYAFLIEAVKYFAPEASEEERVKLLEKGLPNWKEIKALFADPNNPFEA